MQEFVKEILGDLYSEEIEERIIEKISELYVDKDESERQLKELQKNHKNEIGQIKLQNAIDSALSVCGARNQKAVYALIDKEQISIDADGGVVGLKEQLDELKKSDSFLFESKNIKGLSPAQVTQTSFKSPDEMSYNELCEYLKTKNT